MSCPLCGSEAVSSASTLSRRVQCADCKLMYIPRLTRYERLRSTDPAYDLFSRVRLTDPVCITIHIGSADATNSFRIPWSGSAGANFEFVDDD